ncbi:MAG: MqnA/MqnD/SBP family protein [Candidatus Omnitrophota bacterium]|nr:MqnA/MqnD/SBP family protein [Candidatus Omnitrophota bacterium]
MQRTDAKLVQVGHSPDPDDAFMFYALAKEKIPMRGFRVEHVVEDIESLNQRALKGELEVTAVSCHAYAYLADRYVVMRGGSSIGDKYGPILVSREPLDPLKVKGKRIAIPGKLTTAFLAMQLYEPDFEPVFIAFDRIFDAVRAGEVDLGLVIHEGQITYDQHQLHKILDLGEWWWNETKLPLPLGVDVIRRDLGEETVRSFTALFKHSIEFALAHRQDALDYAIDFGRGIQPELNDRFVGMYVNHYTVDMGESGIQGFQTLLDKGFEAGVIPHKITLDVVGEPA